MSEPLIPERRTSGTSNLGLPATLKFAAASKKDIHDLEIKIEQMPGHCQNLEQAAQQTLKLVYDTFQPSLPLLRLYIMLPYAKLPLPHQQFVTQVAQVRNQAGLIKPQTPVLSLLGSQGARPEWREIRKSANHLAIPLISKEFIQQAPMMSAMLKEMGVNLEWFDRPQRDIFTYPVGRMGGVFYVADAAQAQDSQGRNIIPDQDFVSQNRIKSVFGSMGTYFSDKSFVAMVFFTNEKLEKTTVIPYTSLANSFTAATASLSRHSLFFEE